MQPPNKPSSGVRAAALQSSGTSGRAPASGSGRQDSSNREALGLTALKPSEMIAGLNEAAERAGKIEEREEAKRRAGGRMDLNVAMHVDETGARWKRNVLILICGIVAAVAIGGGLMMYFANRNVRDPRELKAETYKRLIELSGRATALRGTSQADRLTADGARDAMQQRIEGEYQSVVKAIEEDGKKRPHAPPNSQLVKQRDWLEKLRNLKDAWGQPFIFELDGDTLKISAKGGGASPGEPLEPVTIQLRGGQAPDKKKDAR